MKKTLCSLAIMAACVTMPAHSDAREAHQFFRIGTGGVSGTYFPVGGLIATMISRPRDSRPCSAGGSCGVDGLIAVVQSSYGSVDNARGVQTGRLESGFVQANVAADAFRGAGEFEGKAPFDKLRVIAALYDEHVHLARSVHADVQSVEDLSGHTVAVDKIGSGSRVDAMRILAANDLDESLVTLTSARAEQLNAKKLENGVDGFFLTAGYPALSIESLANKGLIDLVPITGLAIDNMIEEFDGVYSESIIPARTYQGIQATPTISVRALWVASSDVDDETIYQITKSLWHISGRKILNEGHEQARRINIDTALQGVPIPLHNGAARYYGEIGLR